MADWTYWVALAYGGLIFGGNIARLITKDDVGDRVGHFVSAILSGVLLYWLIYRVVI